MKYKIAGIILNMNPQYEPLLSQSKDYIDESDKEVEVDISFGNEELEEYHKCFPMLSIGECEYMLYGSKFYNYLICKNGLLLHSSCVVYENYAYLFSAPSGTGKSTHTQLWLKRFSSAKILNDDKPAISITKEGILAYGTPFSGKTDWNINECYPIKAIIFLNRGEENNIEMMNGKDAIYNILSQTLRPSEPHLMMQLLNLIDQIVTNIPIYKLYCNISTAAVDLVYKTVNGEKNE